MFTDLSAHEMQDFETFMAVKIQDEVSWVVTLCSVCVVVSYNTTRRHNPEDLDLNLTKY
jgi:hypothetical protein